MARVRLIHWKAAEAASLVEALTGAGHRVAYVEQVGSRLMGHLREQQPEAIVIDLSRLPSHGRMVAAVIRGSKFRAVPLLFVHGAQDKVAATREMFPDAAFATDVPQLLRLLKKAKANPAAVVPSVPGVQRPDRSTARKLGLAGAASVIDAPRGYAKSLGELPEGVELHEVEQAQHPLTLWWVPDAAAFEARLREARRWAARTKLWILWRKGSKDLTQISIRQACAVFGMVDYKICSVDSTWSGMLFTLKK